MTNYDEANGEDAKDVHTRLYQLKSQYKFNKADLRFWFTQFEARLSDCGVQKQWTKRTQLILQLTEEAIDEVKEILELKEDQAGTTPYKDLKDALMELYGPKQEELFQKALDMLMTTTPSALLKKLTDLICKKRPCLRVIRWLVQRIPKYVVYRQTLTNMRSSYITALSSDWVD